MVLPIRYMAPGDQGRIVWIASETRLRQRLHTLGFVPEATLSCKLGGCRYIKVYFINHRLIVLRKKTANEIFAEFFSPGE